MRSLLSSSNTLKMNVNNLLSFGMMLVVSLCFISGNNNVSAAACSSNSYTFANGTCVECSWFQYPENSACVAYSSVSDKMAWDRSASISAGDTGYMIAASAGVLVMTPALALFYGAMASEGNIMNTVLLSIVSMSIISIVWFLMGYSIAFGPGTNFWGTLEWATMLNVGGYPSGCYATTIPHLLFFSFQCMFAIITPALISGAIVGRMTFLSYNIFITVWSLVVYSPIARWVWSFKIDDVTGAVVPNGWLNQLGVVDFAGGTPIHIAAAAAALAASLIVGERLVKKDVKVDVTKLLVGTSLLWFGWTFGFNAGSAGGATRQAATAFINSHLATCIAVAVWMIIEYFHTGKATFVGCCVAAVIGLVAITPACGFVSPQSSLAIGGITSAACYGFSLLKAKYLSKYLDDTLDVFVCHGVSAFTSMILIGIFADARVGGTNGAIYGNPRQIGVQLAAACTSLVYSFCMSSVILLILKYTIGIRVSEEDEINGLDAGHEQQEQDDSVYAPKDSDRAMAVIFTDIERSSALWMKRPTLMQRVLELHNKVLKRVVQRHHLYIVKTIGDAFMIVGASPAAALRFVVDAQSELYAEVWDMPEFEQYYKNWRISVLQDKGSETPSSQGHGAKSSSAKALTHKDPLWNGIRVRIGAHWDTCNATFDQLTKRFDYFGSCVNIAARIESVGHGGQSIVSEQLWAAAKADDPKVITELVNAPLGEVHLRGIRELMTLIQVLPHGLGTRKFPPLRLDKGGNQSGAAGGVEGGGGGGSDRRFESVSDSKRSRGVDDSNNTSQSHLYRDMSHSDHDEDNSSPASYRVTDVLANAPASGDFSMTGNNINNNSSIFQPTGFFGNAVHAGSFGRLPHNLVSSPQATMSNMNNTSNNNNNNNNNNFLDVNQRNSQVLGKLPHVSVNTSQELPGNYHHSNNNGQPQQQFRNVVASSSVTPPRSPVHQSDLKQVAYNDNTGGKSSGGLKITATNNNNGGSPNLGGLGSTEQKYVSSEIHEEDIE